MDVGFDDTRIGGRGSAQSAGPAQEEGLLDLGLIASMSTAQRAICPPAPRMRTFFVVVDIGMFRAGLGGGRTAVPPA